MLRRLIPLIVLCTQGLSGFGQVYFDELYLYDDRVEGIGIGGSVKLSDGYMNWNYARPAWQTYSGLNLFITDFEGSLTIEVDLPLVDTINEQSANIIALNDTEFVALSFQQIITEDTPGDMVLRKLNRNAAVEWEWTYGEQGRLDIPQRVAQADDGGFIAVGQVTFDNGGNDDGQAWLVKTDSNGVVDWEATYGGASYDNGSDVVQTPDGGYLLLGWTRSFGAGQRDFYLIKTDSDGNEEWFETYGGGARIRTEYTCTQ